MATKAERFKAEQLLSRPKKPKGTPKVASGKAKSRGRRDSVPDAAVSGTTMNKPGPAHSATRNYGRAKGRKASYALEDSTTPRPSRKSSRRSKNRVKPEANLHRREIRRTHSPERRAGHGR